MAGKVKTGTIAACLLGVTAAGLFAQATPGPQATPPVGRRPFPSGPDAAAYENVRKAIEALTPEQRKRFQENFARWANLSPEEKKALRDREEVRKKLIEQEVQAALQESGLQLEGERREQFVKRYGEERRLIEDRAHKEMVEKRKPLVRDMIARLKAEFSAGSTPAPAVQIDTPPPVAKP